MHYSNYSILNNYNINKLIDYLSPKIKIRFLQPESPSVYLNFVDLQEIQPNKFNTVYFESIH